MRGENVKTEILRKKLDRVGMEYTKGYVFPDGHRTNEDTVTTVWPVHDEPCGSLTFEEGEDGHLYLHDGISPRMAVWLALAASVDWGNNEG